MVWCHTKFYHFSVGILKGDVLCELSWLIMAEDYLYDVFISYRHKPPMGEWVRNHFYPLLEQRLPDCLPISHETKIFIDWDIETGAA